MLKSKNTAEFVKEELKPGYRIPKDKLKEFGTRFNQQFKKNPKNDDIEQHYFLFDKNYYKTVPCKNGTAEGQVLALGNCVIDAIDNQQLVTIHLLVKALVKRLDDILYFHLLKAVNNNPHLLWSEKPALPLNLPLYNKNQKGEVCTVQASGAIANHLKQKGAISATIVFKKNNKLAEHLLFFCNTGDDQIIAYDPSITTFLQGNLSDVVNRAVSRYHPDNNDVELRLESFVVTEKLNSKHSMQQKQPEPLILSSPINSSTRYNIKEDIIEEKSNEAETKYKPQNKCNP